RRFGDRARRGIHARPERQRGRPRPVRRERRPDGGPRQHPRRGDPAGGLRALSRPAPSLKPPTPAPPIAEMVRTLVSVSSLLVGIGVLVMGLALLGTSLGVRAVREGYPDSTTG